MDLRYEQGSPAPAASNQESRIGPADLSRLVEPDALKRLQQAWSRLEEPPQGTPGQDFDFAELSRDDYRTDTPEGVAAAMASQAALDHEQSAQLEAFSTSHSPELRDLGRMMQENSQDQQALDQLEQRRAETRQELSETEAKIQAAIQELTRLQENANHQRTEVQNLDSHIRVIGIKSPRLDAKINQQEARCENQILPIQKETNRHSPDAIEAGNRTYLEYLLGDESDSSQPEPAS